MFNRFLKNALLASLMAAIVLVFIAGLAIYNDSELDLIQIVSGFVTNPVIWLMVLVFIGGAGLIGIFGGDQSNTKPD